MREALSSVNIDDMPEITDFSKGRRNPFAEKIKKQGYSVTIHYSPEDVASGHIEDMKDIVQALVDLMSENEARQLLQYIKNNYDLPCSPDLWEVLDVR